MDQLPRDVILARPQLALIAGFTLLYSGCAGLYVTDPAQTGNRATNVIGASAVSHAACRAWAASL